MDKLFQIDEATNGSDLAPVQDASVSPAKRRVICDGVKGVLVFHEGRWVLENEAELAVLEALSGRSGGLGRLRGITAALNSPAAGAEDLKNLNKCLRAISKAEPVWTARVGYDLMAATAVACAHWDHPKAIEWLCWALAVRFGSNLSTVGTVAPGWDSFHGGGRRPRTCEQRRSARWLRWVGDDFWNRLASHEEQKVRELAEAIDPDTSPERLERLWASPHDEVRDVIASHPDFSESVLRNAPGEKLDSMSYCDRYLNYRIAQNRCLRAEDIHEMAGRDYYDLTHPISYLLMNHPNASGQTLDRFSSVSCKTVASYVASNPNVKGSTLEQILDRHPIDVHEVRYDDEHCPYCLPPWEIWVAAAANPAMPSRTLSRLVDCPLHKVRAAVAANPSTAIADLMELAGDSRREVRAAAGANTRLPMTLLEELALDRTPVVRAAVAKNLEAPRHASW